MYFSNVFEKQVSLKIDVSSISPEIIPNTPRSMLWNSEAYKKRMCIWNFLL